MLIRVVDRGPGVASNERERIFEPFQRGANGDGRGAGLGLAIARGFAEANGAEVWAESRPGQGATFVVALPGGTDGGSRVSAARVLVVDDEQQILRALQTSLRGAGYEVETADTAERALAAAAMRPPEAVILDLVLPDGTGTDVVRELRSWSSAPVIVLSAVGDEHEKIAALDAGADDYVTKPVGIDELVARLRAVLRRAVPSAEPVLVIGGLEVDLEKRELRIDGKPVHLTPAPVRPAARLRRQRGQAAHPPHDPAAGLGARLRQRVEPACTCTSRSCAARSSPTRRGRATC